MKLAKMTFDHRHDERDEVVPARPDHRVDLHQVAEHGDADQLRRDERRLEMGVACLDQNPGRTELPDQEFAQRRGCPPVHRERTNLKTASRVCSLEHGQVPPTNQLAGPGRLEGVEAAELRRRAGPEVTSSAASNNPSLVSKYCSISHWVAGFGFLQSAPREGSTIGEPAMLAVSSARPACCTSARVKARNATRQKMSTVRANATCPSPQPRPPTV